MKEQNNNKKNILIAIILLLLLLLAGYLVFTKNADNEKTEETINTVDTTRKYIEVEQGDKITWESEQKNFYLPKGWTYEISTNDLFMENIVMSGDNLSMKMEFLQNDDSSLWSQQPDALYKTKTSVLFKDSNEYKAIFNTGLTIDEEDYETGTKASKEYSLFLTITKDGVGLGSLSDEEYSYIKFILDSYDTENSY